MPCFTPLQAYQRTDGQVVFTERGDIYRALELPCGQCIGCRLERSRQWAMRCIHEASLHKQNCFITLTYDSENLPTHGQLVYRHFQLFLKRLRKMTHPAKVRFFMAGEYGEQLGRPHFHSILFGYDFPDKQLIKRGDNALYTSSTLEALWPYGFSSIGAVTFESCAYVARYCLKKITGREAKNHYAFTDAETGEILSYTPEFCRMSLKPGIGSPWLQQYVNDVYPSDTLIINGKETKPPKYYDRLFKKQYPDDFEYIQFERELNAQLYKDDNSPERLAVKHQVAQARAKLSSRKLS